MCVCVSLCLRVPFFFGFEPATMSTLGIPLLSRSRRPSAMIEETEVKAVKVRGCWWGRSWGGGGLKVLSPCTPGVCMLRGGNVCYIIRGLGCDVHVPINYIVAPCLQTRTYAHSLTKITRSHSRAHTLTHTHTHTRARTHVECKIDPCHVTSSWKKVLGAREGGNKLICLLEE